MQNPELVTNGQKQQPNFIISQAEGVQQRLSRIKSRQRDDLNGQPVLDKQDQRRSSAKDVLHEQTTDTHIQTSNQQDLAAETDRFVEKEKVKISFDNHSKVYEGSSRFSNYGPSSKSQIEASKKTEKPVSKSSQRKSPAQDNTNIEQMQADLIQLQELLNETGDFNEKESPKLQNPQMSTPKVNVQSVIMGSVEALGQLMQPENDLKTSLAPAVELPSPQKEDSQGKKSSMSIHIEQKSISGLASAKDTLTKDTLTNANLHSPDVPRAKTDFSKNTGKLLDQNVDLSLQVKNSSEQLINSLLQDTQLDNLSVNIKKNEAQRLNVKSENNPLNPKKAVDAVKTTSNLSDQFKQTLNVIKNDEPIVVAQELPVKYRSEPKIEELENRVVKPLTSGDHKPNLDPIVKPKDQADQDLAKDDQKQNDIVISDQDMESLFASGSRGTKSRGRTAVLINQQTDILRTSEPRQSDENAEAIIKSHHSFAPVAKEQSTTEVQKPSSINKDQTIPKASMSIIEPVKQIAQNVQQVQQNKLIEKQDIQDDNNISERFVDAQINQQVLLKTLDKPVIEQVFNQKASSEIKSNNVRQSALTDEEMVKIQNLKVKEILKPTTKIGLTAMQQQINESRIRKLLHQLTENRDKIYEDTIEQPNEEPEKFDAEFKQKLGNIFGTEIINCTEFIMGVQLQLRIYDQYQAKIQKLIESIKTQLTIEPLHDVDIAEYLAKMRDQLQIPNKALQKLMRKCEYVPQKQCRRYDEFRHLMSELFNFDVRAPFQFIEQFVEIVVQILNSAANEYDNDQKIDDIVKTLGFQLNQKWKGQPQFDLVNKPNTLDPDDEEQEPVDDNRRSSVTRDAAPVNVIQQRPVVQTPKQQQQQQKTASLPTIPPMTGNVQKMSSLRQGGQADVRVASEIKGTTKVNQIEEKGGEIQFPEEPTAEKLARQNQLDQSQVRQLVEQFKVKPPGPYQSDLRVFEKDVQNIKKCTKLLVLLTENKDLIYPNNIQQFSIEDKFDETFRTELASLFQCEVRNATDFIKGIQVQLRQDAQYKDKIDMLVKQIQEKLGIPFNTADEMLRYLDLLARKLIIPYDVTLYMQSQGQVVPVNQCKRYDSFRQSVGNIFQLEIRCPFQFIPMFVDYALDPSKLVIPHIFQLAIKEQLKKNPFVNQMRVQVKYWDDVPKEATQRLDQISQNFDAATDGKKKEQQDLTMSVFNEEQIDTLKRKSKLLALISDNKKKIYSDIIQQLTVDDKFDQQFRNELGYIFGIEVKNATDFVRGVQKQLTLDKQVDQQIESLIRTISAKLQIPFGSTQELYTYLQVLFKKLIIKPEQMQYMLTVGTVFPPHQCKRLDEFRKDVSDVFGQDVRAPFQFVETFVGFALNPASLEIPEMFRARKIDTGEPMKTETVKTGETKPRGQPSELGLERVDQIVKDHTSRATSRAGNAVNLGENPDETVGRRADLQNPNFRLPPESVDAKMIISKVLPQIQRELPQNKKTHAKLLEKLISKQMLIYPQVIQQEETLEDEFDDDFKKQLSFVYGVPVINGADFVRGVQKQLRFDAQFQAQLQDLREFCSQKLQVHFAKVDELITALQTFQDTVSIKPSVMRYILQSGSVPPKMQCRRYDEFRDRLSQIFGVEVKAAIDFVKTYVEYVINPAQIQVLSNGFQLQQENLIVFTKGHEIEIQTSQVEDHSSEASAGEASAVQNIEAKTKIEKKSQSEKKVEVKEITEQKEITGDKITEKPIEKPVKVVQQPVQQTVVVVQQNDAKKEEPKKPEMKVADLKKEDLKKSFAIEQKDEIKKVEQKVEAPKVQKQEQKVEAPPVEPQKIDRPDSETTQESQSSKRKGIPKPPSKKQNQK